MRNFQGQFLNALKLSGGPLIAYIIFYLTQNTGLSPEGQMVLSITAWMAFWWVTETVAMEVTGLLPIILFTLFAKMPMKTVAAPYAHPLIFLFLGAYILALGIEKTGLHKRMALLIIQIVGTRPHQLLFGFMLSTALLSMWMSNTATVVMMLPMALAVIRTIEKDNPQIGPALLLGVAYSASIGGMATLIGTPPNLVFSGVLEQQVNEPISFIKWMSIALPVSVFLLFITWWILKRPFSTNGISLKVKDLKQNTTITRSEKTVLLIFIITAFSWILRVPLLNVFIPQLNDTHIALIGGLSLLIIPYDKNKAAPILSWSDTQKLPWGTLILFGGGLSLASAFDQTGVASWLGSIIEVYAQNWNPLFVIMSTVLLINFTTEITSNLATTAVMLPILLPISEICHIPALFLLGAATLSASCAFMLPVATAPNALVFGSGKISVRYMVKNGIILNLISSISISLAFYFLMIYSQ